MKDLREVANLNILQKKINNIEDDIRYLKEQIEKIEIEIGGVPDEIEYQN